MKYNKISYALVYNRLKRLNRRGEAVIQIRAYQKGRSPRYFTTGIYVEPKFWDNRNKKVRHTHPSQTVLNDQIRDQLKAMETFELKMIQRHGFLHIDRLDEYQLPLTDLVSFTEFFRTELQEAAIRKGTLKNQTTTFRKLCAYKKLVYFEDLTYNLVKGFDSFLHRQKLGLNTIHKHHKNLRKYIKLAIKKDYLQVDANPYKKFSAKTVEPNRVFLNEMELEKIESLEFDQEFQYLDRIRDFLLLCCYTGLRYSDLNRLAIKNVDRSYQGLKLIFRSSKTGKMGQIPLYSLFRENNEGPTKPESLVEKLIDEHTASASGSSAFDDLPFFNLSNQYVNREFKKLAALAGIKKKISTHVGRRTFASMLAKKKVQPKVIQRLLQHSTMEMTMKYIEISNEVVESELARINWKNDN